MAHVAHVKKMPMSGMVHTSVGQKLLKRNKTKSFLGDQ
jgi:hypothetical protein